MAFIEQRGVDRGRRRVGKSFAVEHAEQIVLLGAREGQRWPWPHCHDARHEDRAMTCAIAVHEPSVQREGPAGGLHANVGRKLRDGLHHLSSLVSSAVGSPSATHSFF